MADTSPRSSTFTSIIDAAFSHSMKNEYEQALSQLKIAYELKEPFDVGMFSVFALKNDHSKSYEFMMIDYQF